MSASNQDFLFSEAQRALARGRVREAVTLGEQLVDADPRSAAAWHLLGLARQKQGGIAAALQALTKASSLGRDKALYHHDLGNALADDGKLDRAISSYRRALRIDDTLAEAHNDLGTAYFAKQWHEQAEQCFRKAIELKPDHGVAHANLGSALRSLGRLRDSRRAFQRALLLKVRAALPTFMRWTVAAPRAARAAPVAPAGEVVRLIGRISSARAAAKLGEARALAIEGEARFPNEPDILHQVSNALEDQGQFDQALGRMEKAIALKPERAEYQIALARIQANLGNQQAALEAAERALTLEPGSAEVYAVLSGVYHLLRDDLAEQAARKAIELDPNLALGHASLGAALWGLGHLDEAEHHAREAVRLLPTQVNYKTNLTVILKDAGRMKEARALYREMAGESPDHPTICMNLGTLALECNADLEAARRWYAKAAAQVDDPRVEQSAAIVELLDGRFEQAWPRYEARKRVAGHRKHHQLFADIQPWQGEALKSGRLLVYAEQGLGDEIMFASMLPDLARRTPRITLVCDPRLEKLFARSFPAIELVPTARDTAPAIEIDFDRAVALGSLGQHFRRRSADFPRRERYLVPDEKKVAGWREHLAALGPARKIGLSWRGGVQSTGTARRSLLLEQLRPVLETPQTTWISLQHGDRAAEIAAFHAATGIQVHAFPDVTKDMDDLAALAQACDLVVSVCNTVVHVCGAIGKEVLVMAPFPPEWRYGIRGERMAWYSSARVYRQTEFAEWAGVIAAVKAKLQSERA